LGSGSIIVAVDKNNVIGVNNTLPWRLPNDLKWFKKITLGKTILMGRKTFESLGCKPLIGRDNWVLTKGVDFPQVTSFNDWHSMIDAANRLPHDWVVIGGAALYALALPKVSKIHVTWVDAEVKGDVFFPKLDLRLWECIETTSFVKDLKHEFDFKCSVYVRKNYE